MKDFHNGVSFEEYVDKLGVKKEDGGIDNPLDFYCTPHELWEAVISQCVKRSPSRLLDLGAGQGIAGQAARKLFSNTHITGVEIDGIWHQPHPAYNQWFVDDVLQGDPNMQYDCILSNPPYSNPETNIAEKFVLKARQMLTDDGIMVFILRTAFRNAARRWDNIFDHYRPMVDMPIMPRPSFWYELNGKRETNTEDYSVFVWGKQSSENWDTQKLTWAYDRPDTGQMEMVFPTSGARDR